jgi:hypothetical protein
VCFCADEALEPGVCFCVVARLSGLANGSSCRLKRAVSGALVDLDMAVIECRFHVILASIDIVIECVQPVDGICMFDCRAIWFR